MKKLDPQIVTAIRQHAQDNPQDSYGKIAATFGVSLVTVKRLCSDQGRSKAWRKGKGAPEFDPQKFWEKIDRAPNGCWQWRGCTNNDGYGFLYMQGKSCGAHRVAYQLANGPIPDGMELDHTCKNRRCCRPDHLQAVSHRENLTRAGLIPRAGAVSIEPAAQSIDPVSDIDTVAADGVGPIFQTDIPLYQSYSLNPEPAETPGEQIPSSVPAGEFRESDRKWKQALRPAPPLDPFAGLCNPIPPDPYSDSPQQLVEAKTGTKEELGILDWADTEFGAFWAGQTNEQLSARSIQVQTEDMRNQGETLHWYKIYAADKTSPMTMFNIAARTGPEACAKCERLLGKGWAASFEYFKPDPPCVLFKYHHILLDDGNKLMLVARTERDAISMIDAVWGPGHVLECRRSTLGPNEGQLMVYKQRWRQELECQHNRLSTENPKTK